MAGGCDTMRTLRLERPRDWRLTDTPEAAQPDTGEALVRVRKAGICGTDISGYLGKMPFFSYPRIPGHELGIEVLAVGHGVGNVKPGDTCSVEPYINCGACFPCRHNHGNCCENLTVLGVHVDGGLRPRFIVPARKLHPAAGLTFEQLALVETLAIGCHAVDRAAIRPDEFALVVGAGPIGLSVLEFVRLTGCRFAALDVNPGRLRFCADRMGIPLTITAAGGPDDIEAIRNAGQGNLPTVVIDATGHPRAMERSLEFVGFTGRVVFVGIVPDPIAVPDPLFHRREMTILGSRNALPGDFRRIIDLIRAGKIDTKPWISYRVGFEDVPGRFHDLTLPETGVIKAMIDLESIN